MNRIAVINFLDSERTLLAQALSCASGYPLVQNRSMYEWRKLFKIDESKMTRFENQFLLISASITERIKHEVAFSDFISDGAVFSDALSLQSIMNEKSVEWQKAKKVEMVKNLLYITGKYAAHQYNPVIHIRNNASEDFDEMSIGFYEKYSIAYKMYYSNNDLKDILETIIQETKIPVLLLEEYAIYKAKRLINFTNF